MKRIQAYFENENNTESVKSSLITLDAKLLEIGELIEPPGNQIQWLAPEAKGYYPSPNRRNLKYMMSIDAEENAFKQVVELVHQNQGHVERMD